MGVGVGFAIAAALYCRDYAPEKRVICLQGDSAFGFSGFEVETVARYVKPFPNKPWFKRVCSTSLENTVEKGEIVTSNFSFSHSVFYPLK